MPLLSPASLPSPTSLTPTPLCYHFTARISRYCSDSSRNCSDSSPRTRHHVACSQVLAREARSGHRGLRTCQRTAAAAAAATAAAAAAASRSGGATSALRANYRWRPSWPRARRAALTAQRALLDSRERSDSRSLVACSLPFAVPARPGELSGARCSPRACRSSYCWQCPTCWKCSWKCSSVAAGFCSRPTALRLTFHRAPVPVRFGTTTCLTFPFRPTGRSSHLGIRWRHSSRVMPRCDNGCRAIHFAHSDTLAFCSFCRVMRQLLTC